jgi:uncharacterized Zn ribbon protein
VTDTTPRCVECGTVYCIYREDAAEWWCSDCWTEHREATGTVEPWPA